MTHSTPAKSKYKMARTRYDRANDTRVAERERAEANLRTVEREYAAITTKLAEARVWVKRTAIKWPGSE